MNLKFILRKLKRNFGIYAKASVRFLAKEKNWGITITFIILIALDILFLTYFQSLKLKGINIGSFINQVIPFIIGFIGGLITNNIKRTYVVAEERRLMDLEELEKHYCVRAGYDEDCKNQQANESLKENKSSFIEHKIYQDGYGKLLDKIKIGVNNENNTSSKKKESEEKTENNVKIIPGIIEEYFSKDDEILFFPHETMNNSNWLSSLEQIIKPHEDQFKELYQASESFNDIKVRPVFFSTESKIKIMYVEPTYFYYHFVTNLSCDLTLGKNRTLRDIIEPLLISPSEGLKKLNECANLPITNALGVNILTVIFEGSDKAYIVLPRRSRTVAVEENKYGHTIAGSLDWKTLKYLIEKNRYVDLRDFALQEITERDELGLLEIILERDPDSKGKLLETIRNSLYPIALKRNLKVLGEPDFEMLLIYNLNGKNNKSVSKNISIDDVISEINTVIGEKSENREVLFIEVPLNDREPSDEYCKALKVINDTLYNNLIEGNGQLELNLLNDYMKANLSKRKKVIKTTLGDVKIPSHKRLLKYEELTSGLIIGLRAYHEAYERFCKN